MGQNNIANRLAIAIREIFDAKVIVETTLAGDREARMEQMRRERAESLMTVTRAEMAERYGTAYNSEKPAAEKPKRKSPERKADGEKEKPAAKKAPEKKDAMETGIPVPDMPERSIGKPIFGRGIADHTVEIRELP